MVAGQVLFCPFCRECFEGEERCPEHELALVTLERLGPDPEDPETAPEVVDQTPVPLLSLGRGRGLVLLGALLNLFALLAEMVRGVGGSAGLRGYELAISVPSLWTVLGVSFVLLYVLRTRRTPLQMQSLRLLVPLLSLVGPACVGLAFLRLSRGAPMYAAGSRLIGHDPGPGVFLVTAAAVVLIAGGVRFGRQ